MLEAARELTRIGTPEAKRVVGRRLIEEGNRLLGETEIVIQKGLLDMSDPRQADAVKNAIEVLRNPQRRNGHLPPGLIVSLLARESLWELNPETRVGVSELAPMIGRGKSFLYRSTAAKTIPHRKLDGELVFVVGEIREWLKKSEEKVV